MNPFVLSQGAVSQLGAAVARNGGTASDIHWLCTGRNFYRVMQLAREEGYVALKDEFDTSIKISRDKCRLDYPGWIVRVKRPELQRQGPSSYDLRQVHCWVHPRQLKSMTFPFSGRCLYEELNENDGARLKTCLTLLDGEEIMKKDIKVFREAFKDKVVFLWGSVIENAKGEGFVPYLCEECGRISLNWRNLSCILGPYCVMAHFSDGETGS